MKLFKKIHESNLFILLTNLSIILGVLLFQWNIVYIMILYWFESVSIGFFHFFKILFNNSTGSSGDEGLNQFSNNKFTRLFTSIFFALHYGLFNLGHFVFLIVLSAFFLESFTTEQSTIENSMEHLIQQDLWKKLEFISQWIIFPVIFFNQFSAYRDYVKGRREGKIPSSEISELMFIPYKRIFLMHFTIVIGGAITFFALSLFPGSIYLSMGITVFFVSLKIYQDLN
jgi:hypothetical protein